MHMRTLSLIFLFAAVFMAAPTYAQFDSLTYSGNDSGLEFQPEFPQPGELVTISIRDYRNSSYGAKITWVLDGKVIPDAENQRQVSVTAGAAGGSQKIEAVLTRVTGSNDVISAVLRPVYLDIILEPQTRTPDFYLGRSLPSVGSSVNATVLVSQGSGIRNTDLVYTWKLGQQVLGGGPLRGQNKISYITPVGNGEIMSVQVSELGGTVLARRAFLVPSVDPVIRFYEVNALFGINKKAVTTGAPLISNSLTLRAEPYYLDSRIYNDPAILQWKLGGREASNTSSNPYEIALQRTGLTGSTQLEFLVRDTKQVLQGAQATTRINY